jgi:hypothetical protein
VQGLSSKLILLKAFLPKSVNLALGLDRCSSLWQVLFCEGSGVQMVCQLTMSIGASGGVAADPQRGTKSRLLSTECTDPDQELVWHRAGASLWGT